MAISGWQFISLVFIRILASGIYVHKFITFTSMKRLIIAALVLVFQYKAAFTQDVEYSTPINIKTDTAKAISAIKFIIATDGRRSFITDQKAKMGGIKLGLEYEEKIRAGLGFYFLKSFETKEDTITIDFNYLGPYWEFLIFKEKRGEISLPLQFGLGGIKAYEFETGKVLFDKSVGVVTISLSGYYKFFTWLGIGGGLGYRQMLTKHQIIKREFNAPIYIVKIKIFLKPMLQLLSTKSGVDKGKCLGCYGCMGLF